MSNSTRKETVVWNVFRVLLVIAITFAVVPLSQLATTALASARADEEIPAGGLWFNGSGGAATDGTDGMKFVFHCNNGSNGNGEQIWFTNLINLYDGDCSKTGFHAKVGGTNFGPRATNWTTKVIKENTRFGSAALTESGSGHWAVYLLG